MIDWDTMYYQDVLFDLESLQPSQKKHELYFFFFVNPVCLHVVRDTGDIQSQYTLQIIICASNPMGTADWHHLSTCHLLQTKRDLELIFDQTIP